MHTAQHSNRSDISHKILGEMTAYNGLVGSQDKVSPMRVVAERFNVAAVGTQIDQFAEALSGARSSGSKLGGNSFG